MASDEYYRFIDKVRSRPKVENPTIAEARAALEKIGERMVPPTGVQFDTADADGVPAEWAPPPECDLGRIILYAHGGGYRYGAVATHRALVGRLSGAGASRVLSCDTTTPP